jgi:hypothetical protein
MTMIPSRRTTSRVALSLFALFFFAACADESGPEPLPLGGGIGSQTDEDPPPADGPCENGKRNPGCPCSAAEDGMLVSCGRVEIEIAGQKTCGDGLMVCDAGVWGECILNNSVDLDDPPTA